MTIDKCINELDADDLIFEEGSTGRELFVMLDARSNFEPIMQSVRDRNKLEDYSRSHCESCGRTYFPIQLTNPAAGCSKALNQEA